MEILDNINKILKDDLKKTIKRNSKISIAATCFSIYAYQELKDELNKVDEVKFIFNSPMFIKENLPKEQKEFYIPRLNKEKSLYGTEFEVKLKNELTQKAIAKECAQWIREKVAFKSNKTNENMLGFINVDESTYYPFNGFTTIDLGCERGNNIFFSVTKTEAYENSRYYLNLFDNLWKDKDKFVDVTEEVLVGIEEAYKENAPEYLYFFTLYNIFSEFLGSSGIPVGKKCRCPL